MPLQFFFQKDKNSCLVFKRASSPSPRARDWNELTLVPFVPWYLHSTNNITSALFVFPRHSYVPRSVLLTLLISRYFKVSFVLTWSLCEGSLDICCPLRESNHPTNASSVTEQLILVLSPSGTKCLPLTETAPSKCKEDHSWIKLIVGHLQLLSCLDCLSYSLFHSRAYLYKFLSCPFQSKIPP